MTLDLIHEDWQSIDLRKVQLNDFISDNSPYKPVSTVETVKDFTVFIDINSHTKYLRHTEVLKIN